MTKIAVRVLLMLSISVSAFALNPSQTETDQKPLVHKTNKKKTAKKSALHKKISKKAKAHPQADVVMTKVNQNPLLERQGIDVTPAVTLTQNTTKHTSRTAAPALVASNTSTSTLAFKKTNVEKPEDKAFGIALNIAQTTNLYDKQDGSRSDGRSYEVVPSYQFNENYVVSADMSYNQDLRNDDNSDMDDIMLKLTRMNVVKTDALALSVSLITIIPESKESRLDKQLESSLGLGTKLKSNPELLHGVSLSTGLSVSRNFHKYETALDGNTNSEYTSSQFLGADYKIQKVSLSANFTHKNAWTYTGAAKEAFEHTEELGYDIAEFFSVAVGHTNKGSVFKSNYDSNISLINDNSSMVYGSMSLTY